MVNKVISKLMGSLDLTRLIYGDRVRDVEARLIVMPSGKPDKEGRTIITVGGFFVARENSELSPVPHINPDKYEMWAGKIVFIPDVIFQENNKDWHGNTIDSMLTSGGLSTVSDKWRVVEDYVGFAEANNRPLFKPVLPKSKI